MDETRVSTVDDLVRALLGFERGRWVFRGQADASWPLATTLERALAGDRHSYLPMASAVEDRTLYEFKARYRHFCSEAPPASRFGLLAMMQHHGVPTRLLDFTQSPLVAAFFAVDGAFTTNGTARSAIYALDWPANNKAAFDAMRPHLGALAETPYENLVGEPDRVFDSIEATAECDVLWVGEPAELNLRLHQQQGTFVVGLNRKKRLEDVAAAWLSREDRRWLKRIVFPSSLGPELVETLHKANVTYTSIYPGLDGLGRHLRQQVVLDRIEFEAWRAPA